MKTPDICRSRHRGNPESQLANARIAKRKPGLREEIWDFLRRSGPDTCEHIAESLGLRYTTVSARLSELKADGWVTPAGGTRMTSGGATAALVRHVSAAEKVERERREAQREMFAEAV